MVDVPDRIRVAQDADGFWTCREAISGSQEYVRADLYAALEAKLAARSGAVKALIAELERMTEDELILLRLEASDEIAALLAALEPAEPAPAAEPVACVERGSEQSTPQPESRLREALEGIDSIITNSINENGSDYHRMKIGEDWYDGPVVDALHKILMGLREIARTALAQGGR